MIFERHLSQMTIKKSVSSDFLSTFVDSINVFYCRLSRVISYMKTVMPVSNVVYIYYKSHRFEISRVTKKWGRRERKPLIGYINHYLSGIKYIFHMQVYFHSSSASLK